MTKLIPIDDLVESVVGALSMHAVANDDYRRENLRLMHELGENIVSHPAYKKGAHGQTELFEKIIERVRDESNFKPSKRYLENCVEIYGLAPEVRTVCKVLEESGKSVNSTNALVLVRGESPKEGPKCRHCPVHYPKPCP